MSHTSLSQSLNPQYDMLIVEAFISRDTKCNLCYCVANQKWSERLDYLNNFVTSRTRRAAVKPITITIECSTG
jgi:hypothetical protein